MLFFVIETILWDRKRALKYNDIIYVVYETRIVCKLQLVQLHLIELRVNTVWLSLAILKIRILKEIYIL